MAKSWWIWTHDNTWPWWECMTFPGSENWLPGSFSSSTWFVFATGMHAASGSGGTGPSTSTSKAPEHVLVGGFRHFSFSRYLAYWLADMPIFHRGCNHQLVWLDDGCMPVVTTIRSCAMCDIAMEPWKLLQSFRQGNHNVPTARPHRDRDRCMMIHGQITHAHCTDLYTEIDR